MNTEIGGDLLDRHPVMAVASHQHDVIAELTMLVILINTDVDYQGGPPSTALATGITTIISPDHEYTLDHDAATETRIDAYHHRRTTMTPDVAAR